MAHIACRLGEFTGHIGPVRFVNGHGETDDPDLLEFFTGQPDLYDVAGDETPDETPGPDPEDDPDQE